jgi:hypothetical protein
LASPQGDYLKAAAAYTKALKAVKVDAAADPELAPVYRRGGSRRRA